MKRTSIVLAALCLVTLAGCRNEPGGAVDSGRDGGSIGTAEQPASGEPGSSAPDRPEGRPSTAPGPAAGSGSGEVDGDLDDIDNLLSDTDGELSGADETPPDQD